MDVPEPSSFNNLTVGMSLLASLVPRNSTWIHHHQICLQVAYYSFYSPVLALSFFFFFVGAIFIPRISLCGERSTHTPLWHISRLDLQSTSSCYVESEDDTYFQILSFFRPACVPSAGTGFQGNCKEMSLILIHLRMPESHSSCYDYKAQ